METGGPDVLEDDSHDPETSLNDSRVFRRGRREI
jgi:hypothetical protein